MNTELLKHLNQIKKLCAENKVKTLFAFGSVTTDRFNPGSDIDMIVDIDSNDPFEYSDNYFNLKEQLQNIFKRNIDLLENKSIKNPYFKNSMRLQKF